jgi:hypothetical protein
MNPRVPGTRSGSAYNDLGFIFSTSSGAMNRKFAGTNGHPSKKGHPTLPLSHTEAGAATAAAAAATGTATGTAGGGAMGASASMISRRTDYLETQEKRLTATVSDTRSQHHALSDEIAATQKSMLQHKERTQHMFNESQFLYGTAQTSVRGIQCVGDPGATLSAYRRASLPEQKKMECTLVGANQRIMLTYPMERITRDDGYVLLMRSKRVDPDTAQMTMFWAIVFEERAGKQTRHVSQYSLE